MVKKKQPQRTCVGCRQIKNKKDLIRIVRTPDQTVEIDFTGKRSGRGAYICPSLSCLESSLKAKRLEKTLNFRIPSDIIDQLKKELSTRKEE